MDDHLWIDLRVLYDADHCAQHVPHRGKVEAAHAQAVWRQMDLYAGYTAFHHCVHVADDLYHDPSENKYGTQKEKAGEQCK
jgi:hypothetical protein